MPKFTIEYRMSCHGQLEIDAPSRAEAKEIVENMALSTLGREAEDGEVEVVPEGEGDGDA